MIKKITFYGGKKDIISVIFLNNAIMEDLIKDIEKQNRGSKVISIVALKDTDIKELAGYLFKKLGEKVFSFREGARCYFENIEEMTKFLQQGKDM